MKKEYDFTSARRGAIAKPAKGKTRITIRIDDDVLDWFRARVHEQGGGSYQGLLNQALREHMTRSDNVLAETLRHVLREEMAAYAIESSEAPKRRTTARKQKDRA